MVTFRLLQKMMQKEELAILGGNRSLSLSAPSTPTLSASGSGATLPAATYSVYAVALTFEGFKNSSVAGGVATSQTVTGADGKTYVLSGGSSNKSSAATQAVTLGQTLLASVPSIQGAVAYAWFVGTAGNEKLEKISTINSASFSAPLAGTGPGRLGDHGQQLGQREPRVRRPAHPGAESGQPCLRQGVEHRRRRHRHGTDGIGSRHGGGNRRHAAEHVGQLPHQPVSDLRQQPGAEEHHREVPEQLVRSAPAHQPERQRPELLADRRRHDRLLLQPVHSERRGEDPGAHPTPTCRPA